MLTCVIRILSLKKLWVLYMSKSTARFEKKRAVFLRKVPNSSRKTVDFCRQAARRGGTLPMNRAILRPFRQNEWFYRGGRGRAKYAVAQSKRKSEPERAALLVHFAENMGEPVGCGQFFGDAVGASGGKHQALFGRSEFRVGHCVEGFPIARFFA